MTRWARVARGAGAATVSLFIAAFAHSLAGGGLPGLAGILLCVTFAVLACTALVGRRMPLTRLASAIVISQAMYHWLFGALGSAPAAAPAATLGHVHNAPIDFGALATASVAHNHDDMLLAHIAAAIVTFGMLAYGEKSFGAAIHAARSFVLSLVPTVSDAPLPCAPLRLFARKVLVTVPQPRRVDHSGLRHRGPPAVCFA